MNRTDAIFQIERQSSTLIVTPHANLGECDFDRIETDATVVMQMLEASDVKNVVIDFDDTEYFGSTALSFFIKIWKRVKEHGGHMAFCNLSPIERETLALTHLDHLWSVCDSRAEAMAAVEWSMLSST
jgi:anti-anti-sigma factor